MSLLLFFNQPSGGPHTYNETHTASVALGSTVSSADIGDTIANSLMLNGTSDYLARTFGTPTDGLKWTYSGFVKRSKLGTSQFILYGRDSAGSNDRLLVQLTATGELRVYKYRVSDGFYSIWIQTAAKFVDPTAHLHVVLVYDSANGTSTDRVKLYVNGALQSIVGTVTTTPTASPAGFAIYPTSSLSGVVNTAVSHDIGRESVTPSGYFDGYISNITFVDGQALSPTDFGRFSADTGEWVPKTYAGTYGANGFKLNFSNSGSLGSDSSGNANNWTLGGSLAAASQYQDTPTNNFATGDSRKPNSTYAVATHSLGNNRVVVTSASGSGGSMGFASIQCPNGAKTYAEVKFISATSNFAGAGICRTTVTNDAALTGYMAYQNNGAAGQILQDAASTIQTGLATWAANDVWGIAVDLVNNTLQFYRNNSAYGTPISIANADDWCISAMHGSGTGSTATFEYNFGARPFAYAPPTGFNALNTGNLPSETVAVSGSFRGNALAEGPVVFCNGYPSTLSVNGNAVTFGTHAYRLATGFKLITASASYNASGANTWTATIVSNPRNALKYSTARDQGIGGGTTYNDTITETVATGFTLTNAATFPNAISESVATGCSFVDGLLFANTISESVATDFFTSASKSTELEYLVVAGGGGGGHGTSPHGGAGGGAGGLLAGTQAYPVGTFSVTVGAGGAGDTSGSNSVYSSFTATGGGKGRGTGAPATGGSGGGERYSTTPGATGTSGQGNTGGGGSGGLTGGSLFPSGGGGGAGAVGGNGNDNDTGGVGGIGIRSDISGSLAYYAGGGGGSCFYGGGIGGAGGLGGGGAGATAGGGNGVAGTANSGGGGGGGNNVAGVGGSGGSGVVILKYPDTYPAASSVTGSPSIVVSGGYRTYTWTATGTWSLTLTDPGYNETISESVAAGFSLVTTGTFPNTISESVGLVFTEADNLNGGGTTFNEPLSFSIAAGFSFVEYDPTTRLLLKFNDGSGVSAPAETSAYGWLRSTASTSGAVTSTQGMFGSNSYAVGNPTGVKSNDGFLRVNNVNDLFASDGSVHKQFDIWFRPSNTNSHTIFSVVLNNGDFLALYYSSGTTYALYSDHSNTAGVYVTASFAGAIAANTWAHYRVALNGDTIRIGKDGLEKSSASLGQNIWRGTVGGGAPTVPTQVRVGRWEVSRDAESGYDFLIAQGYADDFVITEGAGVWTGGSYAVPIYSPAEAGYRASDNYAWDNSVTPGSSFTGIVTPGIKVVNEVVTVGFSATATGGSTVENAAASVTLGFSVVSGTAYSRTIAESVAMADAAAAAKTYTDTHAGAVSLGYALAIGAIYTHSIPASVTVGASYLGTQVFVESLREAVLLAQSFTSAQVLLASTSDSIVLSVTFYTFDPDGVYEHVHVYDEGSKVYSQYMRQVTEREYLEATVESAYEPAA